MTLINQMTSLGSLKIAQTSTVLSGLYSGGILQTFNELQQVVAPIGVIVTSGISGASTGFFGVPYIQTTLASGSTFSGLTTLSNQVVVRVYGSYNLSGQGLQEINSSGLISGLNITTTAFGF